MLTLVVGPARLRCGSQPWHWMQAEGRLDELVVAARLLIDTG